MLTNLYSDSDWNFGKKITFRFFSVYFILICFPFGVSFYLPFLATIADGIYHFWQQFSLFFGKHILLITSDIIIDETGAGDTLINYILRVLLLTISFVTTIIWSILDRKRKNYDKLLYYVTAALRYYTVSVLFIYGFGKIFPVQMTYPGLIKLSQPYGNQSPMGLAWSFIGYSSAYSIYTGFAEVFAAFFLLFRKTLLLGSLLMITVMLNVFMLNMCYDIPVKLDSFDYLLLSILIALNEWQRLLNFFIHNKQTSPVPLQNYISNKKLFTTSRGLKYLIIAYMFYFNINDNYSYYKEYRQDIANNKLRGIYNVKEFICNNDTLAPLTTDTLRWEKLIIDQYDRNAVQLMNDKLKTFDRTVDTLKKIMVMKSVKDSTFKYNFTYSKPNDSTLILNGGNYKHKFSIRFIKFDDSKFLLNKTGFNWINEYPLNR